MSDLSINTVIKPIRLPDPDQSSADGAQGVSSSQSTQAVNTNGLAVDPVISQKSSAVEPAATTRISRQSQLFNQLQQLQAQDPDKLKQVLTDVASKLTAAAQNATGHDQKFLTNLADKFTKAAGGDITALKPPSLNGSNPTLSAYQQAAKTTPNGQILDILAQAPEHDGGNGQRPNSSGKSGGHPHHGGHGHLSAATQQTLQNVFQDLHTALSGVGSTSTTLPLANGSPTQSAITPSDPVVVTT